MSLTLSNGYKKPESGDLGTSFFPDLEDNIDRINAHSHNGVDSNKLTALSFTLLTDNIVSGDFGIVGSKHRVTVTVPAGISVDATTIKLRDPTTKEPLYLKVEKITTTTFYIYSMFAIDVEVVYG